MKILITGIHGFVGTNLVSALKNNHTICGLDIVSPLKEGVIKTFSWNELDSIPPVDVIIHLAGKAHDTKNQSKAKDYFDINTELTKKIYDWFLTSNVKKFIFFSSVKAAAHRVEGEILTEDIISNPKGPYGESKIAAENYLISQQLIVNSQQKRTYILRPCMIHGPGNKGNLNLLYQLVKKGIPYPLGAFENRRSFTSVDNLCFVISELIEKDIPDGIYNMGDDESLSTNELLELIAKTLNKPIRIWKWNKPFIQFCVKIGTVLHLPLNDEKLQKLTENYVVSNMKLKKALKIDKMPVRATDGFIKTIQSFEKK
jgi:nucleoside-diphosphate-sugar epimerase